MFRFTVYHNDELIKTYEIEECPITIGRLPENSVSIANMGISRRHVKIERDANRNFILSDLNSLNGTFVNNKKVKKTSLFTGDRISIGKYTIVFEDLSQYASQSEPPESADAQPPEPENLEEEEPSEKENNMPASESDNIMRIPHDFKQNVGHGEAVLIETNKHVVYKIDKALFTIGNSEEDDIFASGFMIGENHIFIEKKDGGTWINSKNKMSRFKVNGKKTNSHLLQHKDRIEIGNSTFRYMING